MGTETLNLMKAEGWKFPAVREAEAMFEADTAPEWAEGDVCNRCRVAFGMMTRRHHCRACGQVFCSKCSSKSCHLPKFGIEREVRVCDPCFDLYGPKEEAGARPPAQQQKKKTEGDLPAEYLASALSKQNQVPQTTGSSAKSGKSEAEIKEEEELQLAIALSQSEAEEKEKQKLRSTSQILNKTGPASQPATAAASSGIAPEELDPELVRYLDRDYWEQKEKEKAAEKAKSVNTQPSSLQATSTSNSSSANASERTSSPVKMVPKLATTSDANSADLDEFVTTLRTQLEIFVNRMKSNSSRGRSITNDSSVQTLFMNTMAMHSKLLKHIQDQEDKRVHYEGLQDKLAQVKDARAALEALREEERERKRREAEEAEKLRQSQMREKLELMRQKKTEYLQYQRQLAMQRMQEQERDMMLRQEQSRQQYHQQQMQYPVMQPGMQPGMQFNPYYPPGAYMIPPGTAAPGMPGIPTPPGTAAPGMPGMQAPPGTTAPSMPSMPAPPASASGPQAPVATQSPATFNMGAMTNALPGHPGAPGHPGGPGHPGAPMYPGAPYMMQPGPMPQMPQPGMQPPTHQPGVPQQPQDQQTQRPVAPASNADVLAELISFD